MKTSCILQLALVVAASIAPALSSPFSHSSVSAPADDAPAKPTQHVRPFPYEYAPSPRRINMLELSTSSSPLISTASHKDVRGEDLDPSAVLSSSKPLSTYQLMALSAAGRRASSSSSPLSASSWSSFPPSSRSSEDSARSFYKEAHSNDSLTINATISIDRRTLHVIFLVVIFLSAVVLVETIDCIRALYVIR
ncbi:MAG: hypothetical protein M1825_003751 [Sarcosagium campestre]|nr:MAG: hypothetical protein M1825_003751 [Sarcosagium campestre]